jgi:hypothetical protein
LLQWRNTWSNQWWLSRLIQLVSAESIHGTFPFFLKGLTNSSTLHETKHQYFCLMQPNLSASWLFQRAMSAKKQSDVPEDFINELLYANFSCMKVVPLTHHLRLFLFLCNGCFCVIFHTMLLKCSTIALCYSTIV